MIKTKLNWILVTAVPRSALEKRTKNIKYYSQFSVSYDQKYHNKIIIEKNHPITVLEEADFRVIH